MQARAVLGDGVGESEVQGVRNQGMAYAHLVEVGHGFGEVTKVVQIEVVACVHPEAGIVGPGGRLGVGPCCFAAALEMLDGERFGVEFDAVRADVGGCSDLGFVRFDEQRSPDAFRFERFQDGPQHVPVLGDGPSGVAGEHVRRVGDKRDLLRFHLADHGDKVVARVALDVEFGVDHLAQITHIRVRDVPRIGPRVNRDAVRPKRLDALGCQDHVGLVSTAGVAQGGNFVDVDAEACHPYLWVITRKYAMRAQRILSLDLPVLALTDQVARALDVMDEFKLMHLPVVEEDVYKGTVSEDALLEMDPSAVIAEAPMTEDAIAPDLHVYDIVARMGWADVDVLPVVHEGLYRGAVDRAAVLRFMAKRAGWGFPGSSVVLEVLPKDLSPAELMRIVEADGAQITSFNVAPVEDSEFLEVTFKVNTEEIESLLSTLRRHEFNVQSFYNAPELEDEMRARFDAFMRFLEP